MRIVLVASEVLPFAKTGGMADVCGTLSLELERQGHEVSIIMPGYRSTGAGKPFNARARVAVIGKGIKVYFLQHGGFYDRPYIYGSPDGDYEDNLERFAFLCHGACELLKELGRSIDVIHCHDWQAALIPLLLKTHYAKDPFFERTRSVMTVHNLAYQGIFPQASFPALGVDEGLFNADALEFYGKINLLKGGLIFADQLTTVSPRYAKEAQTREWGCGLEGVIKANKARWTGILNGLDYDRWDPQTDEFITPHYSSADWQVKARHKEKLQNIYRLPVFDDIPVFGFVGRLCHQKGLDLIEAAFEGLMQRPLQVVFIGIGEEKYQKMLVKLARKYPQQCAAIIRYDEDIAHMVYAGADLFFMPSVYEPCGLTQMIALRYGAIPVVNPVGGLLDTVIDFSSDKKKGNGFRMDTFSVSGLLEAVDRALGTFHHKDRFGALVANAMACRWPLAAAAEQYIGCYEKCLSRSE